MVLALLLVTEPSHGKPSALGLDDLNLPTDVTRGVTELEEPAHLGHRIPRCGDRAGHGATSRSFMSRY